MPSRSLLPLLFAVAAASLLAHLPAVAAPVVAGPDAEVPAVPLDLIVASPAVAVTDAFVEEQLAALPEVYRAHRLSFRVVRRRSWPGSPPTATAAAAPADRAIETRADRDALAAQYRRGAANVFLVTSLEDVDEAHRHRFGVCWRNERDPAQRYVIVASYAPRGVLAHELGHLLGLSHSGQMDNVMSYTRTGKPPFFLAAQGATMRQTARDLFGSGFFAK